MEMLLSSHPRPRLNWDSVELLSWRFLFVCCSCSMFHFLSVLRTLDDSLRSWDV